ncbi:MAG: LysM peptidoglycan-binding domain-containing protein, partial [Bacteroidota bacterium]|nr:LysM peptidoglycan-binding domain-containing protein [Bacteroidota bacterium]
FLGGIAEQYDVGLSKLMGWNGLTEESILAIGQQLTVYSDNRTASSSTSSSSKVIHTVKSGEVLSVIAEKYNVGLSQVIGWNNITDAASLRIGQELVIYPDQSNLD